MDIRHLRLLLIGAVVCAVFGCGRIAEQQAVGHYQRGAVMLKEGMLAAAMKEMTEAIRARPDMPEAHTCLGDIHRRQGRLDEARDSYVTACELAPYAFRPHYNLGVTYQLLAAEASIVDRIEELLREAAHVYLRAIIIKPDDFEANLNISACYYQLGRFDQAEEYCRAAIRARADSAHAWSNLGIVLDSQNKLTEAVRAYKQSLEYDTHQPMLLLNLGTTYKRLASPYHLKWALRAFELAAKAAPDLPAAWEQIGLCHFEMGDYGKAVKALVLDEQSPIAHRGIGAAYMMQYVMSPGDLPLRTKGIEAWRRSVELDPDQPKLATLLAKYRKRPTAGGL